MGDEKNVVDRRASAGATDPEPADAPGPEAPLPPVDFSTFVLSLGAAAMTQMGYARDEAGQPVPADLAQAKHTIDLLAVFEEKAAKGFTGEEERLLTQTLFDLRMAFVQRTKK